MILLEVLSAPAPVSRVDLPELGGLDHLSAHLAQCMPARPALHRVRGIIEATNQFVMPRVVSSIAGVGACAVSLIYILH